MKRRAVFLDRDGTLIQERHYLRRPEDIELVDGAVEALAQLRRCGLALILVTNQSGIARGMLTEDKLAVLHEHLAALLAREGQELDGIYYCPHLPEAPVAAYRGPCNCRKPAPGLVDRAAQELDLQLSGSWVVGDKASDMALATARDLRGVLVRSGYGRETEAALTGSDKSPEVVVQGLREAAAWIVAAEQGEGASPPSRTGSPGRSGTWGEKR